MITRNDVTYGAMRCETPFRSGIMGHPGEGAWNWGVYGMEMEGAGRVAVKVINND